MPGFVHWVTENIRTLGYIRFARASDRLLAGCEYGEASDILPMATSLENELLSARIRALRQFTTALTINYQCGNPGHNHIFQKLISLVSRTILVFKYYSKVN